MFYSQKELIDTMKTRGYLKTKKIIYAFNRVDRKDFVQDEGGGNVYGDFPLPIGSGQTISQPSTVAFMLELLRPEKSENILDIGSGSGWTTALLAEIVGKGGSVLGLERVDELVGFGSENLNKYNFKNASIEKADKTLGKRGEEFDKILVSAGADMLPQELVKQLQIGGIMVIPIKNSICRIKKISEDDYSLKEFQGFIFVPLIDDTG
ncbi:methyltransferase domain-containing protein [Candidatus Gracilibacteria bacterium 28_42_T64]|nr:methyltransferase domain-containing protein [Candidatus Gracilibacteria bacterium 28_42_T64]